MAAHDISSITPSAMVYYLAKNAAWQERCPRRVAVLAAAKTDLAALDSLASLDPVFREAMGACGPSPGIGSAGGAILAVVLGAVHILPDRWNKPESFDPDRYGERRHEDKRHRFQDVPFGGDVHKCIGMNFGAAEEVPASHILLQYSLEVPEDYQVEWDHTSRVVPTDGMPITLRKIS
jgi:cytochrome P450